MVLYAVLGDFGGGYYSAPLLVTYSRDVADRRAAELAADSDARLGFDGFEVVEVPLAGGVRDAHTKRCFCACDCQRLTMDGVCADCRRHADTGYRKAEVE